MAGRKKISLTQAVSIGVGGMVGGGIFAVLGLAVSLAKGGTPMAFFLAGVIALLTAHSYAVMSTNYPNRGGTVTFLNVAFGRCVFTGAAANLLWISYIVMLSLYAAAFGSYAPNLFTTGHKAVEYHIAATAVIVIATAINYLSVTAVARIEQIAVGIKLVVLAGFVALGAWGLKNSTHLGQLNPGHWENPVKLFAGGMVIFVAYEGFELIANAACDIACPKVNIARAFYICVSLVVVLYVVIAIVTVGSLSFSVIATAQDYVLAKAATPILGRAGFTIMTIAALLSTFSAINASLLGGSRVNYEIAKDDQIDKHFLMMAFHKPIGLAVTAVATIIMVNVVPLEAISTTGSVGFLLVFAIVNISCVLTAKKTHCNTVVPILGTIGCCLALVVLVGQQVVAAPLGVVIAALIIVGCLVVEWAHLKLTTPVARARRERRAFAPASSRL